MADPFRRFEINGTRLFTITYSSQPGTTPYLAIYTGSGNATLVSCATAVLSGSTYSSTVNVTSEGFYGYTWVASFTNGPDVVRGLFRAVRGGA